MFDLNGKSLLKTAKFGLGMTILVLATACSHEVVQQPPLETSANTGVENIPDATPTPEPEAAKASVLDNGSNTSKSGNHSERAGKKTRISRRHGNKMLAKGKKSHGTKLARKIVKSHSSQKVSAYKQVAAPATTKPLNENVVNMAASQPPVPPAPAAIGSVGDGNLGTVDMNADNGGFFSGLLGYWPYGFFAIILGGGLFLATRGGRKSGKKGGRLVFNS